jgi:glycosyltransferase involved in cell wall biosynthesis
MAASSIVKKKSLRKNNKRASYPRRPMVSVVIPCYNAGKTLRDTLSSVVSQAYPSFEIIAVDDGSTDDTHSIICGFGEKVKLLTQANQGASAARNSAFKQAVGEILLLLDSDAKVFPKWIQHHVDEQIRGKKVVGGSVIPWNDTFWGMCDYYSTWYEYYPQKKPQENRYQISSTNLSIHSSVIQKIGYFDTRIKGIEDAEYTHRMAKNGFSISFAPHILMAHHDRETLQGFLKHHYVYGYNAPSVRTQDSGTKFSRIMPRTETAAFFMILPLAILHTAYVLHHWLPARPEAILFTPFIFASKVSHAIGVYHGVRDGVAQKMNTL